jgi:hypothetical protein
MRVEGASGREEEQRKITSDSDWNMEEEGGEIRK